MPQDEIDDEYQGPFPPVKERRLSKLDSLLFAN